MLSLIPLQAQVLGWTVLEIGTTGSAYFLGFIIGCVSVPRLLARAGYIRVLVCFSALAAGVSLILESTSSMWLWCLLRLTIGWSLAAIYSTTESWINDQTEDNRRGRVMSVYVVVTLLGIACGQVLLGIVPVELLFRIAAMLMLLSVLPVGLFCEEQLNNLKPTNLKPSMLGALPIISIAGVTLGGIVTGSLWTLAPLVGEARGFTLASIGLMMNTIILGGALLQLPLGIASDRFGRKKLITAVGMTCLLSAIALTVIPFDSPQSITLLGMFFFGGSSLTLYALCAAAANDQVQLSRVETASILLLLNGLGSMIGPLLAGAISLFTINSLFVVSILAMSGLLLVAGFSRSNRGAVIVELRPSVYPKQELPDALARAA